MKNLTRKIASSGALFVALWTAQTAMGWYDPSIGRWLTRDPIGEPGFQVMQRAGRGITSPSTARWINRDGNLYTFVANNPVDRVDPLGLKIWVCSVETSGFPFYGLGTHAYFWDDRTGTPANKRECGKEGSLGYGGNSSGNIGPSSGETANPWDGNGSRGQTRCFPVDGSDGKEDAVMGCCRKTANNGIFFPWINDCHNSVNDCLGNNGLKSPPHTRGWLPPKPTDPVAPLPIHPFWP
jgi:hypothetical protein